MTLTANNPAHLGRAASESNPQRQVFSKGGDWLPKGLTYDNVTAYTNKADIFRLDRRIGNPPYIQDLLNTERIAALMLAKIGER